jgi:hypothetical protein
MGCVLSFVLVLLLAGGIAPVWASPRELSDAELDQITAGAVSAQVLDNGQVSFQFGAGGGAIPIDGAGTITPQNGSLLSSISNVVLNGNAQSNLHSLVNITAISSAIQVLINLNVNIHSTVGSVRQFNGAPRF